MHGGDGAVLEGREPSLLGRFGGDRPPAPPWFEWAIAQKPERASFLHDGIEIELLIWGEVGRPGLLFVHGNGAHADWWSFIAPFFAAEGWRCAAISFSGMGRSGKRPDGYKLSEYADEAIAAIAHAKLDNGSGVIVIAHSLGGYPALIAGARCERIKGVISLDSAIAGEALWSVAQPPPVRPNRIYATEADALARYRFVPARVGGNSFIIDHIARWGLCRTHDESGREGWTWCLDPRIWLSGHEDLSGLPRAARCPLAFLIGGNSELTQPAVRRFMREIYPKEAPFITIPDAGHHIMIDQPLALVSTLRACLAYWPRERRP